jgi:hypothetical protein
MMDFKEPGSASEQGAVDKNKGIAEQFPILFDKVQMEDGTNIYVECSPYRDDEDKFKDEDPRIFLLPSGPVMLSTTALVDSEMLWKIEEDRELLSKLVEFAKDSKDQEYFRVHPRNYRFTSFEYESTELLDKLENKKRKRKALKK